MMDQKELSSAWHEICIFLSYSVEDKEAVGSLRNSLKELGFDAFCAHEDIPVASEWEETIIKKLKRSDVFVPFLSEHFRESEWTDQETGMAVVDVERKLIISLQTQSDFPPHGFIKKYQSLPVYKREYKKNQKLDFDKIAEEIWNAILKKDEKKAKRFAIDSLLDSGDFMEANARVKLLERCNFTCKFTVEEINEICKGVLNNNQVSGAYEVRQFLRKIIPEYSKDIKPEIYEGIEKILKEAER